MTRHRQNPTILVTLLNIWFCVFKHLLIILVTITGKCSKLGSKLSSKLTGGKSLSGLWRQNRRQLQKWSDTRQLQKWSDTRQFQKWSDTRQFQKPRQPQKPRPQAPPPSLQPHAIAAN